METECKTATANKWFAARVYADEAKQLYIELQLLRTDIPDIDDPVLDDEGEIIMFRTLEQIDCLMDILQDTKEVIRGLTPKGYHLVPDGRIPILTNRY